MKEEVKWVITSHSNYNVTNNDAKGNEMDNTVSGDNDKRIFHFHLVTNKFLRNPFHLSSNYKYLKHHTHFWGFFYYVSNEAHAYTPIEHNPLNRHFEHNYSMESKNYIIFHYTRINQERVLSVGNIYLNFSFKVRY